MYFTGSFICFMVEFVGCNDLKPSQLIFYIIHFWLDKQIPKIALSGISWHSIGSLAAAALH